MDYLSDQVLIIIISSVFLVIVAVGIILLVSLYQKKQLLYVREKEQIKVAFEQQILESKLEIQEQTFKNISQEVHDNIGQVLSLAKLTIDTDTAEDPGDLLERMGTSKRLIGKAIDDLRNLSRNLNTDYITDLGLKASIENEVRLIKKATPYEAEIVSRGEEYRLQHQQELIIFRIFQEVLQNVIKHSAATTLQITFDFEPDSFSLQICDNGIGFNVATLQDKSNVRLGIGIRNMRQRAKMISAVFTVSSNPGEGTTVEIKLPVNLTKHE